MPQRMKVKVIYNKDIRIFKITGDATLPEMLNKLQIFTKDSFQFKTKNDFKLHFKDDENDLLIIADVNDLKDALTNAKNQNCMTRIYVTPDSSSTPEKPVKSVVTTHLSDSVIIEEGEESHSEPESSQVPVIVENNNNNNKNNEQSSDDDELPEEEEEEEEEEVEVKESTKKQENNDDELLPICKCGCDLIPTLAGEAYANTYTICDGCNVRMKDDVIVYHCMLQRSHPLHKEGYDLCQKCGELQLVNLRKKQMPKDVPGTISYCEKGTITEDTNNNNNNNSTKCDAVWKELERLKTQQQMMMTLLISVVGKGDLKKINKIINKKTGKKKSRTKKKSKARCKSKSAKKTIVKKKKKEKWVKKKKESSKKKVIKSIKSKKKCKNKFKMTKSKKKMFLKIKKDMLQKKLKSLEHDMKKEQVEEEEEVIDINTDKRFAPMKALPTDTEEDDEPKEPEEPEVAPMAPVLPVKKVFVYSKELETLQAMGFNDSNEVRALLVRYRGNMPRVCNHLLG